MKKIITFLLIAALSSSAAVMAQQTADTPVLIGEAEGEAVQNQASYIRVTAGAARLSELDGAKFIEAVDSNGEPVEIVVGDDALVIGENGEAAELVDGMQFTVFVNINKPMVLSMPPRYNADVVVVDTDMEMLVDADTYTADGDSFVNAANTLSIAVGETEIVDRTGAKYEGELDGRDLVVFYDISTRSIPAQTNPKKVVVFAEPEIEVEVETEDVAEAAPAAMYVQVVATADSVAAEDGVTFVEATDANGEPVNFVIGEDTLVIDESGEKAELAEGTAFTAYTAWNQPMVLMLPPRYNANVIVVDSDENMFADVDAYTAVEDRFVNDANTLSITIEGAEIVDRTGAAFDGDISGKDLVVFYGTSTRSIPVQANAAKVIVLGETGARPDEIVEEVPVTKVAAGDKTFDIVEKADIEVLPVRAVSEALGLEVKWDNDLQAVTVGTVPMGVNFNIGVNSYNKARMTPFTLEGAPYLEMTEAGGVTYVPVSFFTEVLGCTAETADGVMTLTF